MNINILYFTKLLVSIMPFYLFSPQIVSNESKESSRYQADSLEQLISTTEDFKRIIILDSIAQSLNFEARGLKYINQLEKLAIEQSNKEILCNSYFYKANYYGSIARNLDSASIYLEKARSLGLPDKGLRITSSQIALYANKNQYTTAIIFIKEKLEESTIIKNSKEEGMLYLTLSHVYENLHNTVDAIEAANKCLKIMDIYVKTLSTDELEHSSYFSIKRAAFWILIEAYRTEENYNKALNCTDSILKLNVMIDSIYPASIEKNRWVVSNVYIKKAEIYTEMNDSNNAKIYLDLAKESDGLYKINYIEATYFFTKALLFNKEGEYEQSLSSLRRGLGVIDKKQLNINTLIKVNTLMSKNLHHIGRGKEAFELLSQTMQIKDSIDSKQMSSQMNEFQTIYNVNKMKSEIDLQAIKLGKTRIVIISLSGGLILLCILFIIARKSKKDKEIKNKKMYEQYELMKSYLNKIREQREMLSNTICEKEIDTASLAEKAHSYLLQTEAFKNESLSRDDLATYLGTNRQYLIDAIKNETGKTFKDYINSIRIECAYEMLIINKNATIEDIYMEVGLPSRRTFNRLFKEQYGMTPIEMRVASSEEEAKIMKHDIY